MIKQSDIHWPTVAKLFAGGAMAGAGLGAGTSLIRYLQTLNEKAQEQADHSQDDDVLYIKLPPKGQPLANRTAVSAPKYAAANNAGTFATGSMAGILGTYLAYNAIRDMYQKSRKAQLQKELDSAHHMYLGNLSDQSALQKQASQFGLVSKGVGTGYLALLLSALGSGVVANKMLGKFFPPVQRPFADRPRKIVLESDDPAKDQVDEPAGGVTPDEVEHLVRTTASQPKEASVCSQIADLVAAAAQGRCEEIRENAAIGVDLMFDTVKGARFEKTSSVNRNLAATWLSVDPLISEAIQPVLAAAFYEMSPGIFDKAAHVPAEYRKNLVDFTIEAAKEARRVTYAPLVAEIPSIKQAEVGMPMFLASEILPYMMLSSSLQHTLKDNQDNPEQGGEAGHDHRTPGHTSTPISKDSPDMSGYRSGHVPFEISGNDAKNFAKEYGPTIDKTVQKL